MNMRALIESREVIVCCGTGGVGKTTTSAAVAMAAASMGRHAAVVTIDPAKRLADALGIDALHNDPTIIDGPWPGTLAALMLDTKATFDAVVRRHAADDEQVDRILDNRFYVNVSTGLSGTQDYMAVEKLADLHSSGDWDLVVVDTPPTRDALAFLEAPKLLTRLLDNAIYKLLISPQQGVLRAVNRAAGSVVRQLSRVVGADVVDDAIEFFQTFQGMEEGFKERADATLALLGDDATAFVLVASPRADTLSEATYFLDRLGNAGLSAAAVVVNRMLPDLTVSIDRAEALRGELADGDAAALGIALADHAAAAAGDDERVQALVERAPDAVLTRVPLLPSDVHDVATLRTIANLLTR
ncbi:MAG: ArsA-related P-loop ATPase [Acidimicrobiales bacterium]|jgi:anion-transporting  ArsA/GET3 family ATPase|nr:ArsA-related P-loop ATPase [Acidimicrobiales bacterium]